MVDGVAFRLFLAAIADTVKILGAFVFNECLVADVALVGGICKIVLKLKMLALGISDFIAGKTNKTQNFFALFVDFDINLL